MQLQKLQEKGDGGWERKKREVFLHNFLADQKIASSWKMHFRGIL